MTSVMINNKQLYSNLYSYMNTNIEAMFFIDNKTALEVSQMVDHYFRDIESIFSRFDQSSELTFLNQHAGELCEVSSEMMEVLTLAEYYRPLTNNLFNIFVLEALNTAGYSKSFELIRNHPIEVKEKECVKVETPIQLLKEQSLVLMNPTMSIDLGGIVKGWSVQNLSKILKKEWGITRGMINAGGDISLWGGKETNEQWVIGIENPWFPSRDIGVIVMNEGAIATSSKLGRQWLTTKEQKQHHLIDPRLMKPSQSNVVQCTVTGCDVNECEVWAKTLCILNLDEAIELMNQKRPRIEAILFTNKQKIHYIGHVSSLYNKWEIDVDEVHDIFNQTDIKKVR